MDVYIDVRGVWPLLVIGYTAIQLEGEPRDITVDQVLRKYNIPLDRATEQWALNNIS